MLDRIVETLDRLLHSIGYQIQTDRRKVKKLFKLIFKFVKLVQDIDGNMGIFCIVSGILQIIYKVSAALFHLFSSLFFH